MTVRKVEIERLSVTSSKPFEVDRGSARSGYWASRYGGILEGN